MEGYLGEEKLESYEGTRFEGFTPHDWAMEYIGAYGQIDGSHHKQWVLDQVARILKGTPVILKVARWKNGHFEYRYTTGEPSSEYKAWVMEMRGRFDPVCEEYEYDYDDGCAP